MDWSLEKSFWVNYEIIINYEKSEEVRRSTILNKKRPQSSVQKAKLSTITNVKLLTFHDNF